MATQPSPPAKLELNVAQQRLVNEELEPKPFLRALMSSRTAQAEKAQLLEAARQLRGKSQDEYLAFLESLLAEVDSVADNRWAMARLPIPLPSYRTKLGCLNRMLTSLLEDGMDENVRREGVRARTLAVLVRQLETAKSVRALEAESLEAKSAVTMADMLKRTPEGLETPAYKVVAEKGIWEVRQYDEFSVCSFEMGESPEKAGFGAFNSLAGYIFGTNQESVKMQMTTPVINHGASNKMSFVMPSSYWTQGAAPPTPIPGSGVKLEQRGGGMIGKGSEVAVLWFGGFASKDVVADRKAALKALLQQDSDWQAVDEAEEPLLLQYNDPFVPPWKRRNEVVLSVAARVSAPTKPASAPASAPTETDADASKGQSPPPAQLELPMAKLGAVAANKRQWGIGQDGLDITEKSIAAISSLEFEALERLLLMDLDGDGEVDVKEFKIALCSTGLTEAEAKKMFEQIDLDGSGSISFAEFVKAVKSEVAQKKIKKTSATPSSTEPAPVDVIDFEARLNEIRTRRTVTLTQKLTGQD